MFHQEMYSEARKNCAAIITIIDVLKQTDAIEELADHIQDQADSWVNTACCYRLEKSWDEAEKSLNEARALAPEDSTDLNKETEQLKQAKSQALLTTTSQVLFSLKTTGQGGLLHSAAQTYNQFN
ncbi:MAG: hypothetical protein ACRCXC_00205 [Legionella sp.]